MTTPDQREQWEPPEDEADDRETCGECGGAGREWITPEMAGDAGQPELADSEAYCRHCGGSGHE
jgi:DnaJ-class molecular chaperone